MQITKEHLDKRICDVEVTAFNTETYRQFIRDGEEEFNLPQMPIDEMEVDDLNKYLDFLDYLWTK